MIYSVVLVSSVQQSDSVYIYIEREREREGRIYVFFFRFFSILGYYKILITAIKNKIRKEMRGDRKWGQAILLRVVKGALCEEIL